MVRLLVLLTTIAAAAAAIPGRPSSFAPFLHRGVVAKKAVAPDLLELRGGGISIDPEIYTKACAGVFGVYGAQMLIVPESMVTVHFDAPKPDTMTTFWIRGTSAIIGALVYAMLKLPADEGAKTGLILSAGSGILYPWNAKFGYLSPDMPLKYPMHYLPEILFLGLSIAGILAIRQ